MRIEWVRIACDAKRAVIHISAGPSGDLADLFRFKGTNDKAIEFFARGKCDMINIHIDAHADCVRGDHEIYFAGLVQRHLCVPRPRTQGAEHDGSATALAADGIGERVHILNRESDDGRAARQPGQFSGSCVCKIGKTWPRDEMRLRGNASDGRFHGAGAEPHRLFFAARVQQPVGEDVTAFGIGAQLDFVHREEGNADIYRHGFHRADVIARRFRYDAFFAGDQSDFRSAAQAHKFVEHFAGKQSQRQADHPGAMRQHSLNGKMRFSGVRRAENGGDAHRVNAIYGRPLPRHWRKLPVHVSAGTIAPHSTDPRLNRPFVAL